MKRKSCLTLALILVMVQVISLFAVLPAAADASKNYDLIKAEEVMTVDGVANEAAWAKAAWSSQFVKTSGSSSEVSGFNARFKAVWSEGDNGQMNVHVLIVAKGHLTWRASNWRNNIRVRIETSDGSQVFYTGMKALENGQGDNSDIITNLNQPDMSGTASGGASSNIKIFAVNDIANSGTATYELCYQMPKADSIKLDVLASGCTTEWADAQYSWAGMHNDATEAASGIGMILDTTDPLQGINIIKTEDVMTVDGVADEAAWSNAEWSSKFVKIDSDTTEEIANFNVRFKAVWSESDNGQMNVHILIVAKGHLTWRTDNYRNHIRVRIGTSDGMQTFWTGQQELQSVKAYDKDKILTGNSIGGLGNEFHAVAVDDIANSGTATYELSYQMPKSDFIELDVLASACPNNWGFAKSSWAGMDSVTNSTAGGGTGTILDTTDPVYSIDIMKTTQDIQIDGIADDVWAFANSSENFQTAASEATLDGFTGSFKVLWSPVEGNDELMNLYILVVAKGHVTWRNVNYRNNVRIRIESADGTFWTGQKQLNDHVINNTNENHLLTGSQTGDLSADFYMYAVNDIANSGTATYEFCYQMKRADIKLDVLVGACTNEYAQAECSWTGMAVDAFGNPGATNGVGTIVDTTPAELLENLNFVVDKETQGAAVYLNTETPDLSGIRFATTINVDAFNGLMAQGATITTGTLVTYTENLTGIADGNFKKDVLIENGLEEGVHFYDIVNEGNGWVDGKPGTWFATIYDVQEYSRQFSAVGYVTIEIGDVTTTIYETYNETNDARSIAYVAETLMAEEMDNGHIGLDALEKDQGRFTVAQEAILESFYKTEA